MDLLGSLSHYQDRLVRSAALEVVARRKDRVLGILAEGLPALPPHILALNEALTAAPVDLEQINKLVRSSQGLSAKLIRLCNSAAFGLRRTVSKIEEAAVLMGAHRLRVLVFTSYLLESCGRWLCERDIQEHWRHSFTAAILSERAARVLGYPRSDQVYLAGLLHDIGKLPLLMVSIEGKGMIAREILFDPPDNLEKEREYFGLNHCEVGRWIGVSWNFRPRQIEVFYHHHAPELAKHDPMLVGIVSVADRFCEIRELQPSADPPHDDARLRRTLMAHMARSLPAISLGDRQRLTFLLEAEYENAIPMVEQTFEAITRKISAATAGLTSHDEANESSRADD